MMNTKHHANCFMQDQPINKPFINALKSLVLCGLAFLSSTVSAFDYGDPTSLEQAHLELINRARANPLLEAQRLQIDLFEGVPAGALPNGNSVQPLSSNALLLNIARSHSSDMLTQDYFAHNDITGKTPFDRMTAAGYIFQAAGENIRWQGTLGTLDQAATTLSLYDNLFLDQDVSGRGHRLNILDANFREVGVGLGFGPFLENGTNYNSGMVTTDFGARSNGNPLILGVVYVDNNADQFYNAGEGLANVSVVIAATNSTQTASAGGYGLEVGPNSNYTVTFTHPTYGTISKTVRVDTMNVKVDVLSSNFTSNGGTIAQCATYNGTQLAIPCITVAGSTLSANLTVANNNPLQFSLKSSAYNTQNTSAQCGTYDIPSNTAHLNCVIVGSTTYWADLTLKGAVFELGAYGIAP